MTRIAIRRSARGALLVLAGYLAAGCSQPSATDPADFTPAQHSWFADVTAEVKLDFTHDPGPIDGAFFMPQIIGSGAALFDFDNDGRLDILLLQNGGPKSGSRNKLFRQNPDGRFTDVSAGSGLDIADYCMGVAVGDINNDGLPDVYVSAYGGGHVFLNRGKGRFEEVGKQQSGLDNAMWATAVSFLDYDRDGWLDLVVVNYVDLNPSQRCSNAAHRDYCNPNNFKGTVTRLYRNRGCDKAGQWLGFEDRTESAGLSRTPGPGLGVCCADFNGDGWPDIFVANDAKANCLWINQRNGTFAEEAVTRGVAYNAVGQPQGNMGVAFGDVDGDGLSDLFVTHLTSEHHALWQQGPRGLFQDRASAAGLTGARWRGTGFGTVLADFDQDGALDLAVVNGRVARAGPPSKRHWDAYRECNQVFANDGTGRFRDISSDNPALCALPNVARGLAVGDIDGDGALDLLVTQIGGPARIFRNVAARRGHWLLVRAVVGKRDAIGAEVRVQAGKRRWQRVIQPAQGYLCSNDLRAHFGLGAVDRIEAIDVLWPDGTEERFTCASVDCVFEVHRGNGQPIKTTENRRP